MSIAADEIMAYIQGYLDEAPDKDTAESILDAIDSRIRDLVIARDPLQRNLVRFTVESAAHAAGRPLTDSELHQLEKGLPFSTMGDAFWAAVKSIASLPDDDVDGVEGRAGDVLEAGVIHRRIGDYEWECAREVDRHGDTVLVTTWGGDECSYDRDEVIETTTIPEED